VPPTSSPGAGFDRPASARRKLDAGRARDDRVLFERYRDERDPVDRELLVERFLPLARQLASRYARSREPFDDLFQVASLGLVKAIDRFDLRRGIAFSSFAVPTITGELKRHFRDRTWAVHVPRDLQELALRVDRAVSDLTVTLHRPPTVAEICAKVGANDEDVLEALQAARARTATSLDAPRGANDDGGDTLDETLSIEDGRLQLAEDRAAIGPLIRRMSAREREVLRLRFVADLTQAEIGRRVGVSQMQVCRIIRGAIARLQAATDDHDKQAIPA
jgi:RNA polymerase sigma-B factor